jgi:hypothetical protein
MCRPVDGSATKTGKRAGATACVPAARAACFARKNRVTAGARIVGARSTTRLLAGGSYKSTSDGADLFIGKIFERDLLQFQRLLHDDPSPFRTAHRFGPN